MAGDFFNAYLFLGPELGKKQDAINAVRSKIKDAEVTVFYAGEASVTDIADTIQNHSLFAQERVIIIKNAELFKKKDEVDTLVLCIKNLEPDTTIFLLSDEFKIAAGLDDVFQKDKRQIFYEMFEREKNEWVRQFFKREGFDIDEACISIILEMVENNTDALGRECSRLMLFLPKSEGAGKKITAEQVEKWLSHSREESPFTLFSRIAAGDLSKALESLSVMLAAKQSAQGILAVLASCFRKLNDYLNLLETGDANNSFELRKIGLSSPKIKDDYIAASRRYNSDAVERCLALTCEYDTLLRSPVAALDSLLMDRYLINVMRKKESTDYTD